MFLQNRLNDNILRSNLMGNRFGLSYIFSFQDSLALVLSSERSANAFVVTTLKNTHNDEESKATCRSSPADARNALSAGETRLREIFDDAPSIPDTAIAFLHG